MALSIGGLAGVVCSGSMLDDDNSVSELDPAGGAAGPEFTTEVKMLAATLHHHAGEEERLMFPQSHALGEEALEALGTQMEERKKQLENSRLTLSLRRAKREVLRRV